MPSLQSQLMEDTYVRLNKHLSGEDLTTDLYRIVMEEVATVAAEPTNVTYEEVHCPGTVRPAIWCLPQLASAAHVILYIHGGGFISGSPSSHRKVAAHLAKKARCRALVIDYRRAPEHQFPKQIEDVVSAYTWLINDLGFSSKNIAFAGDSAGGNLTVSAALTIKTMGLEIPAAIVAFSPWFDMKLTGQSWQRNAKTDSLVQLEAMQGVIDAYVGESSLEDPCLDLLRTDLTGLPPMYLTSGTAEVLEDDAALLAETAKSAGNEVHLVRVDGMQHIWVLMAGNAPEADDSLSQAANFICRKMERNFDV
jgi:monoterpene epsilon-lactone hydrolase